MIPAAVLLGRYYSLVLTFEHAKMTRLGVRERSTPERFLCSRALRYHTEKPRGDHSPTESPAALLRSQRSLALQTGLQRGPASAGLASAGLLATPPQHCPATSLPPKVSEQTVRCSVSQCAGRAAVCSVGRSGHSAEWGGCFSP